MNAKICLFHDYLSDISPSEKAGMLREMPAEVIEYAKRPIERPERPPLLALPPTSGQSTVT